MFVQEICKKDDEYYTPDYAVRPIIKYLKPDSTIWCPFDTEESEFVKQFRTAGFDVIATHIWNGQDFFNMQLPDCDYIISNPPYSKKLKILVKLFEIGVPWAMLISVPGMFDGKTRYNIMKDNPVEIMAFDSRIQYISGVDDTLVSPPFASIYLCSGILPKQIVFEELHKPKED